MDKRVEAERARYSRYCLQDLVTEAVRQFLEGRGRVEVDRAMEYRGEPELKKAGFGKDAGDFLKLKGVAPVGNSAAKDTVVAPTWSPGWAELFKKWAAFDPDYVENELTAMLEQRKRAGLVLPPAERWLKATLDKKKKWLLEKDR
jgi:hypothetical protein